MKTPDGGCVLGRACTHQHADIARRLITSIAPLLIPILLRCAAGFFFKNITKIIILREADLFRYFGDSHISPSQQMLRRLDPSLADVLRQTLMKALPALVIQLCTADSECLYQHLDCDLFMHVRVDVLIQHRDEPCSI